MPTEAIHPAVRVGHVHLRVADLDRAVAFYRDGLGFAVTADARPAGLGMVLLAAGDYHHHIGLNTFDSAGGPPPAGHSGLYHVAFLYPDRRELGWPCAACSTTAIRSTTPPTTAAPSRSTWPIPTATGSSSTTTARARTGRTPTAGPS